MARSIDTIYQSMIAQKEADDNLKGLTSSSSTAIWRLLFYIFATCAWAIEKLIDTHKSEIQTLIDAEMPHTLTWYQAKAKAFRYGQALMTDSDEYDDTDLTDEDIENMQIVKCAAVVESDGGIIVKVATENGDDLEPISEEQLTAFKSYMGEIKDAGVPVTVFNYPADLLSLNLIVRVDASVIDASGNSILEGNAVIEDTINEYLRNLPFNGELILASLVDALQTIDGVKVPHISSAKVSKMTDAGYGDPTSIEISDIPYSGYYSLSELNLTIQ